MRTKKAIHRIVALMVIFHIIGGTWGILLSSHTCNGCGTHEERVLLLPLSSNQHHDCTTVASGECCGTSANDEMLPATGTCCSNDLHSCYTHDSATCCEYHDERVALEILTRDTGKNQIIPNPPVVAEKIIVVPTTIEHNTHPADHSPQLPDREVNLLICCFII